MAKKRSLQKAKQAKREGKSSSTQAGEFVRDEIDAIRRGEHGARSAKQAIAIGLSQARRAGVDLPAPKKGSVSSEARKKIQRDREHGEKHSKAKPSPKRSKASLAALQKEPTSTVSTSALSSQAKTAAKKRTAKDRSSAAKKAVRTKGKAGLAKAARKAAKTRKSKK